MYFVNVLPRIINIGYQGEGEVTSIQFDVSDWVAAYPSLPISISFTDPQDSTNASPFLASGVTLADGILTWLVGKDVTQHAGLGTIVVRCADGDVDKRSAMTQILIEQGHGATGDAPELMADWLGEAATLRQELADSVDAAGGSASAASGSAATATTKADEAASSAQAASTSAGQANTAKQAAETARDTAITKAGEASESAQASSASAGQAATAKQDAQTAKGEAVTAKEAAQAARDTATTKAGEAGQSAQQAAQSAAVYGALAETVAGHTTQLAEIASELQVHKYGIFWDEVNATCKRLYDALNTTLTTTNFGHFGSVNASYNNPFDGIYPWSGRLCCNIDVTAYQALAVGADIKGCVTAWEGDVDFAWDGTNGPVMVYTPEFWATDYAVPGGHVFIVADGELPGYTYFEETIGARWFGSDDGSGGLTSVPNVIPIVNVAMSTIHSKATAKKMTLDDVWTWCADSILLAVEYATLNSQTAIGNGVDTMYRQSADRPAFAESGVNRVILADATATNYAVGGIIDIGTSDGASNIAHRIITSITDYATNSAYACINFDGAAVDILTTHYISLHGKINTEDSSIGSKSGYIGANSKSHAYYRGRVAHASLYRYVLGAYRQKGTGHIWVAHDRNEAAAYDALNTAVHIDTGCILPQGAAGAAGSGYVSALHYIEDMPLAPFGKTIGGNSASPTGDYVYTPSIDTANTILRAGGNAGDGANCGRLYGHWGSPASGATWNISGLPFLKTP